MIGKKMMQGKNKWLILGIVLIMASGVAFGLMLVIPFLPLSGSSRMIGSGVALIAMEVLFWTGSLLAGKELISKYRDRLNLKNWFRKTIDRSELKD